MYSRKVKIMGGKKKSKSPAPVWGPRIALIEKQKALSQSDPNYIKLNGGSTIGSNRKQNSYCTNTGRPLYNNGVDGKEKHKKVSVSSLQSSSVDGASSNYIYNYARKASTSASSSSGTNKSFFLSHLPPSSSSTSSTNHQYHRCVNNKSYGGSSYILGSNSGSHITLSGSTVGGDTISQPLTLIIPPADPVLKRLEDDFDENRYNVLVDRSQDSFPSTRTYRSSDDDDTLEEEDDEIPEGDMRRNAKTVYNNDHKYDIVGKSSATNGVEKILKTMKFSKTSCADSHAKNNEGFSFVSNSLGILKLSTTKPSVHNGDKCQQHLNNAIENKKSASENNKKQKSRDKTEDNNLNKGSIKKPLNSPGTEISDLRNLCNGTKSKNNSTGSTISSLAHGITMVYVPMESLPRSKSAAVLNASLDFDPDISDLVNGEDPISDTISKATDENRDANSERELSVPCAFNGPGKDPDNDSLLESFDSIMFKPREDQLHLQQNLSPNNISDCSTPSQVTPTNIILNRNHISPPDNVEIMRDGATKSEMMAKIRKPQLRPTAMKVPPPLPPKNPSMLLHKSKLKSAISFHEENIERCKAHNNTVNLNDETTESQRDKNIRAAVENLENIINPTGQNDTEQKKSTKVPKRVTLTLPNHTLAEMALQNGHSGQEMTLNFRNNDTDTEIDAYSSTFMTCGHVLKEDDYSTLSSPTHSPQGLLLTDPEDTGCGEITPGQTSSASNSPSEDMKEKNRSVLQQLRELSILIGNGGQPNDQIFSAIRNNGANRLLLNPTNIQSFRLHNVGEPTRKISDVTDNSADSGKGSGSSGGSTESPSGSSPKSHPSSPDSLHERNNRNECCPQSRNIPPACAFRSDCNECLMYNKPSTGFQKPSSSEELCAHADNIEKVRTLRKISRAPSTKRSSNGSVKILRRKSSRSSKTSSVKSSLKKKKKPVVLDYCECSCCDAGVFDLDMPVHGLITSPFDNNKRPGSKSKSVSSSENARKISTGSSSSGKSSIKLNRSVAFRNSVRSSIVKPKSSPLSNSELSAGLFTIEEIEESPSMESKVRRGSKTNLYGMRHVRENNYNQNNHASELNSPINTDGMGSGGDIDVNNRGPHWHPDCWLAAADPMLGWSDLESLYSLNLKNDKPLSINGECWTCWQEISDIKRHSQNPNGTVDRTKRMFIWLNKRHKEFQAPWWQAKKQASIRWIMTKALTHVPKEYLIDPFKESHKSKPTTYRLREEVIRGLVSGKLYSLSLANLYQLTLGGNGAPTNGLSHWEIIKILSRKGVYVAQPSDMKLTEGTLRQKPIRISAHIALIEAIMSLYSKEILARDRINATLYSFGCTVKSDTTSPEKLVIAWINASVMTLKSYIMSTRNHQLTPEKQNRWLQLPQIGEIRDLCDGIGICSLFAIYCSNDLKVCDISVPDPGETLTIYDSISNHSAVQKLCQELFPETIYHLCVTDFLYIHGYMKQNILCFLVDLFIHLEVNPIVRVNRLTHVPIRVELSQN